MIDIEQALNTIDQLVKEKGRVHVTAPAYVMVGQPVCLVGQALYRLGFPIATLIEYGYKTPRVLYQENAVFRDLVSFGASEVFQAAQSGADSDNWGRGIDKAINVAIKLIDLVPEGIIREQVALAVV